MGKYTATLDNGRTVDIEGTSLGDAVEEACWVYGEEHFILAVEQSDKEHTGDWVLTDTRGFVSATYPTKADAIAHGDNGVEVLIAVPKL